MLKIVRQSKFTAKPWKNGGGTTHEALRKDPASAPPDTEAFLWRVSVAHIEASGPFSDFTGYRRSMVLLQGDGVRLSFSDRTVTELRSVGDLVTFDGALAADCQLLGGTCVDLNLMTAAAVTVEDAGVETLVVPLDIDPAASSTVLIFCIDGTVTIQSGDARTEVLERWDLAAVSELPAQAGETPPQSITLTPHDAAAGCMVFVAKLID